MTTIRRITGLVCLITLMSLYGVCHAQEEYQLVWADEFETDGKPDSLYWSYETGFERNEELQWYQPENVCCRNGLLIIEARSERRENPLYDPQGKEWRKSRQYIECTSSSIKTSGKKEFLYGRLEVRARIPVAKGAWPAIWTLGTSMEWPSCGEIDVMEFYRRNYIEGLFLSSGVLKNPDYTMELLYATLYRLRHVCNFQGYIHVKAIPGADPEIVERTGYLADRMSVNLELPTAEGLRVLAPQKQRSRMLAPIRQVQQRRMENRQELALYRHAPKFVPAGQSTQMIVGASGESDFQILKVAEHMYREYEMKRVFYSAFVRVNDDSLLPALPGGPPLLREHRLYQADWLLRFYGFHTEELLSEERPDFNVFLDPKCDWALRHLEYFPVEVMKADYQTLLRVPGIGVHSARRIVKARRLGTLDYTVLKKMGVVLKRAVFFITCGGRQMYPVRLEEDFILRNMLDRKEKLPAGVSPAYTQLSLFDDPRFSV